ncbi:MAG TPA: hypothetical protein DIW61_01265 [Candidatus Aminicenantes bacterium]|nr:hypothetical protein [Candidatus Aminicenantes bacterium]
MLIINADDLCLSPRATDNIIELYGRGAITSTSAMVFMGDSSRAAELAKECGIDTGLHLNFTQKPDLAVSNELFLSYHGLIARYLTSYKYRFLMYSPALRKAFDYVYHIQYEEFERLFGSPPTHIDGHHHMHLCSNMIVKPVIPRGHIVRRNFTYAAGEKDPLNRAYRSFIDMILKKRYLVVDHLVSLSEKLRAAGLHQVLGLARRATVELQAHPEHRDEFAWLSGACGTYAASWPDKGDFTLLRKLKSDLI